jgi:hypothetical protein
MSPDIAEAIRHEHNATMEAVHRAQARTLHLGEMLLQVRQELGPVLWNQRRFLCLSTIAVVVLGLMQPSPRKSKPRQAKTQE